MNRSSQRQILSRPDIRTKNATAPFTSCRDPAAVMSTAVIQVPPSWYFGQGAGRNPGPGRRRSGTLTQTGHPCQPPNLRGPGTTGSRRCPRVFESVRAGRCATFPIEKRSPVECRQPPDRSSDLKFSQVAACRCAPAWSTNTVVTGPSARSCSMSSHRGRSSSCRRRLERLRSLHSRSSSCPSRA